MRETAHSVSINPYPGRGDIVVLFGGQEQTAALHKAGPHVLDYYLVHYIVSGKGSFHGLGREYHLYRGCSFFTTPGELISYVSDAQEPWHYRWVGFKGTMASQLLSTLNISQHNPVLYPNSFNPRIPVLFHRIQQILNSARPNCDLQSSGYMKLLLAEYAVDVSERAFQGKERRNSDIQKQVEHAVRWLTLQYSQPISIDQMAQKLGYHRTHLSKMFKQYTGLSPKQYLMKVRMEKAEHLLTEPLPIEQIATAVGFTDALYFSKQFHKWHGVSPSKYRENLQRHEGFF